MPRRSATLVESLGTAPPPTTHLTSSPSTASLADTSPAFQPGVPRQANVMRAALYTRVSTEKQERDETIGSQLAALHQAGIQRGYQISDTDVFRDEGYSGARLDRPALDRLRDLVAEGN